MRFVRVLVDDEPVWGVIEENYVRPIDGAPYENWCYLGTQVRLQKAVYLPPCTPTKIVCVGKNYAEHAREMGGEAPDHPILFIKAATTVNGPGCDIPYPSSVGRLDYEGELAFMIGRRATRVKACNADKYICGYTCLNDVTARDIQKLDGQWTRGKGYDGFAPVGPHIETDFDPSDVGIETRLNGEIMQSGRTSQFLWDVPHLLEFITEAITLEPGDLVSTGTPKGIGPMKIGDTVEITIEGLGTLKNQVARRKGDARTGDKI